MSGCLEKKYLPIPPRLWERTHATCEILFEKIEDGTVFYPYFNRKVSNTEVAYLTKMLYKGNILQYPSPSTNVGGMTKKTNYARIAKGFGKYRKKAWASQTDSYTIPNTNMFHRSRYSITSNNLNGEIKLPECDDEPYIENNVLPIPSDPIQDLENPVFPPLDNPADITSYDYPIIPIIPIINNSVIEGGRLSHCTRGNICTGVIQEFVKQIPCFPTSASDVPGPIINLCYPSNFPAFYPRVRKTYTNTSTKWPINAKVSIPAYNEI